MNKYTILTNREDRSYISDMWSDNNGDFLFCNDKILGLRKLPLGIITSKECANSFLEKEQKEINFKYTLIKIGVNNRTGDRSYTDKEERLVAENKTHFQIMHEYPWGWVPCLMIKSEHTIERFIDILQDMKNKRQWGGIIQYCINKIQEDSSNKKWYDEIIEVYNIKKKPIQAGYYRKLRNEQC